MSKLIRSKNLEKYVLSVILALIISGCGTTSQSQRPVQQTFVFGTIEHNGEYYVNRAQQAPQGLKQSYLLQAARAFLANNQLSTAQQILSNLNPNTLPNDDHRLELQLLNSMFHHASNDPVAAINALNASSHWQVTSLRWQEFYHQKHQLQKVNQDFVAATISLISLSQHLVSEQDVTINQSAIWQALTEIPHSELKNARSRVTHFNGWQALALAAQRSAMSPVELQQALTQWTQDYSNHPAVNAMPQALVEAVNVTPYLPQKIAVLLPLSGRYEKLGRAVQNGLVANLLSTETAPELITFDTQQLGAAAAYQQAIAQGAQFIIGPLLKNNVEIISQLASDIPVLLLNQASQYDSGRQHYTFSLDKESEAIQGSQYIFNSGKKIPAIIAPNNANGHKIATLFSQHWQQLAQQNNQATHVEQFFFNNDKDLKLTVEKLFETNQSQVRINQVRLIVGSKMKSETRSRRDIDAIYLVANPQQTYMLKPSIDVTVSAFSSQVPVYVGSTGNADQSKSHNAADLNQLYVSEQPWLLKLRDTKLSPAKVKSLWPKLKQSQLRFFAMGYDAYQLVGYLAQMELFPQFKLEGFSGRLSLGENNHITREMSWAQYQRGKLRAQQ